VHAAPIVRRILALLLSAVVVAGGAVLGAQRVRADEQATLANLLLAEQMVDVATTQQLLHSTRCSAPLDALVEGRARDGTTLHCVYGDEADPLARPFVGSALTNAAVAVALNGVLRLTLRGFGSTGTKALRYGVEIYPAVLIGNVSSIFHIERTSTSVSLSIRRRL
jgi:hypothetical protein